MFTRLQVIMSQDVITIRGVNQELYKELSILAKTEGRNLGDLANDAFTQYISRSKESKTIARQLLTKALDGESDLEIRNEIIKRLRILAPRVTVKTRCQYCGQLFEQKLRKVRKLKLCEKCYQERYAKEN